MHPNSIYYCDIDVDRCIHHLERCWLVFRAILLDTMDPLNSNLEKFIPKNSITSLCVSSTRLLAFSVFPWCFTLLEHSSTRIKLSISSLSWSFAVYTIKLWRLTCRKFVRNDQQIYSVGLDVVVLYGYDHVLSCQISPASQRGIRAIVVGLACCNWTLNRMCMQVRQNQQVELLMVV